MFIISCTSGHNIDLFQKFLSLIKPNDSKLHRKSFNNCSQFFDINDVINGDIGTIVEGDVLIGSVNEGDVMKLGPAINGDFYDVKVESIQRNYESYKSLNLNQNGTLKIKPCNADHPIHIRKGMILVCNDKLVKSCLYFFATIIMLKNSLGLKPKQHLFISIGNVQQNVSILSILPMSKRNTAIFTAKLKFTLRPEIVLTNQRFIFNDGAYKGVGIVTSVL